MVVPRKPERFEEVAALAPWVRRSRRPGQAGATAPDGGGSSAAPADLFLVDTMGEAEAATALADVVAVGRSWNGLGASNPVPPALLGKPTVIGPDHENFSELVEALVADGAVMVSPEAWKGIGAILDDPEMRARMEAAGLEAVGRHRGATERNVALIRDVLRGTARSRLG